MKQNYAFLLEKEDSFGIFLGGKPPNPPGSASRKVWVPGSSAKQNYAFYFFFRKKKTLIRLVFPTKFNRLLNSYSFSGILKRIAVIELYFSGFRVRG
jgi:hypothetical protein